MKNLVAGIFAHVDAGKTTLSESILFEAGIIKEMGRVDKKNTFFDTYEQERARGITIFSKQATLKIGDFNVTLIDTPGHIDFSSELCKVISVIDYGIIVISGTEKLKPHTFTIWNLLKENNIPVFIFVNKMDYTHVDRDLILMELSDRLDERIVDFSGFDSGNRHDLLEHIAMTDELAMDEFISEGTLKDERIKKLVAKRKVFPCYFGSALKYQGITTFFEGMGTFFQEKKPEKNFGGRIFKVSHDDKGNRLTHMKITGGSLKVKDLIKCSSWEGKANEIRIYSGEKYVNATEVRQGEVCAITGLKDSMPGDGVGFENKYQTSGIEPVLSYRMIFPGGETAKEMFPQLQIIKDDFSEIDMRYREESDEITVKLMGEVQIEVLEQIISKKLGVGVKFGEGRVLYKETIDNTVEGVGHFEPLRHYAEVHVIIRRGERGSGIVFKNKSKDDMPAKNRQNLIMNVLETYEHKGVLTGGKLTDVEIILVAGAANVKHTDGGDFREATIRAVRQGLMEAESRLLEPYYEYELELPRRLTGKAANDIEKMSGSMDIQDLNDDFVLIKGRAPMINIHNYRREVNSYSSGEGRLTTAMAGYDICHNEDEVLSEVAYNPEADMENPTGSIFCTHGAGYYVPYDQVKEKMHIRSFLSEYMETGNEIINKSAREFQHADDRDNIDPDEVERIFSKTFFANSAEKTKWRSKQAIEREKYKNFLADKPSVQKNRVQKDKIMIVDGYNVIHDWQELSKLLPGIIDGARSKLLEILSNYSYSIDEKIIVVFDAYRVKNAGEKIEKYDEMDVVFTKEGETADQYIEKFAYENRSKYDIRVVTSDAMQQLSTRVSGAYNISSRELLELVEAAAKELRIKHKIVVE